MRIWTNKTPAFPRGIKGFEISLEAEKRRDVRKQKRGFLLRQLLNAAAAAAGGGDGSGGSPEEFSHLDASFVEQGRDQLSHVQPDVRDVDGDVFRHLQDLVEPDGGEQTI